MPRGLRQSWQRFSCVSLWSRARHRSSASLWPYVSNPLKPHLIAGETKVKLQKKAEKLSKEIFVGGPVRDFERVGRLQLITFLKEGLYPDSKILDFGCGCLRGGYWLIHFLEPGCYFGIEPNRTMLEAGIENLLEPGLLETKKPRFDYNTNFDSSSFGERFDFFLARSIWTHASKSQIQQMLDSFVRDPTDNGLFLTS